MTRGAWHEQARALKAADPNLTYRAIGERFGVTPAAAFKALHPGRAAEYVRRADTDRGAARARRRRCAEAHRGVCVDCGAPTQPGTAWLGTVRCQRCNQARRAFERRQRRLEIARLWRNGLPVREIASQVGSTAAGIGTELARMRADGWDVPRRRNYSEDALRSARDAWRKRGVAA